MPPPNLTNWSNFPSNPIGMSLQPFFDLLGYGWLLIPISVIGGALWLQKRDPMAVTLYFTATLTMLSGGSGAVYLWGAYQPVMPLYIVLAAIGWTALIIQTIFLRR